MTTLPTVHRSWFFGRPVHALVANRAGDTVAAALGDGSLAFLTAYPDVEQPTEMAVHQGISLSLAPDADDHAFLSGGDDGKIFIIDPKLAAPTLLADHKGKWVDHVVGSHNHRAYSIGKTLYRLDEEGNALPEQTLPSSVGGLAFSPNGKRLAASHYNGVSLIWMNAKDSTATHLPWKGSHLNLIWHPDGKILLSSMQDNCLHGWRMADMKEMRMEGYAGKIQSMEFTVRGKYLATSGAGQVICWPFTGGGPWGKPPLTLGSMEGGMVTTVAPHPRDEMLAAGYDSGLIIMAPLDGRMDIMIHPPIPDEGRRITGLVWNKEGDCLFAALESGTVLLFTVDSVRKAVAGA